MKYSSIEIREESPVCWLRINRPHANNSIDATLVTEMTHAINAMEQKVDAKILILEGSEEYFCSGNDFQAMCSGQSDALSEREKVADYYDLLLKLTSTPLVTIALIEGKVLAGGVGFVAACDLAYSDEKVTFALSELLFGLLPACVLPFLIRRIGSQRARMMALTTQTVPAESALNWGLLDQISDNPRRAVKLLTTRLACLERDSIARLKNYTDQIGDLTFQSRELAIDTITPLLSAHETREKIRRFVEDGVYPWQSSSSDQSV